MTRKDYRLIAEGLRNAPESVVDEMCCALLNNCPNFNEDKFHAFVEKLTSRNSK